MSSVSHPPNAGRAIRLLPPVLRNQIAAGEVVERPASVLKELLENSLDAGARSIAVTLEDGGQTLLAVRDDGHGIPAEDLELAVTRHATSKVASFTDLLNVASYGFRGEALPSIGSIADMRVESVFCLDSSACQDGAFIRVRHGEITEKGFSALPRGTLIEVRDLFANVPARLKFLKKPITELQRCEDILKSLALARLDVAFSLHVTGKGKPVERLRLGAGQSLVERLERIRPKADAMHMLEFDRIHAGIRAHGLVSIPTDRQSKANRSLTYVNGRPVNNRQLHQALHLAYKGKLVSQETPDVILFLEIDPKEVDVNVHPAKTEVRFRDEKTVFGAVMKAVSEVLEKHAMTFTTHDESLAGEAWASGGSTPPDAAMTREPRPPGFWGNLDDPRLVERQPNQITAEEHDFADPEPGSDPACHAPMAQKENPLSSSRVFRDARPAMLRETRGMYAADAPFSGYDSAKPAFQTVPMEGITASPPTADTAFPRADHMPSGTGPGGYPVKAGPFVCLGQVAETYLVLLRGNVLLLMDQHAAHERVLLHGIETQAESAQSQLLALPVEVPVSTAERDRLEELLEQLTRLGFSLTTSETGVYVNGVPPLLGRTRGVELLRDILAERTDGMDNLLHLMACRSAIKAGQRLTGDEAAGLLNRWLATPDKEFCPHGRPTILAFDQTTLEKMFKRKV